MSLQPKFGTAYFQNVTMVWDPIPRTAQDIEYRNIRYPLSKTYGGNMPALFNEALELTKQCLLSNPTPPATIAWRKLGSTRSNRFFQQRKNNPD